MWNTDGMTHELAAAITAVIRGQAGELGWSAPQLAKESGVPYQTLRRYLKGNREIPLGVVESIAAALDRSVSWIIQQAESRRESNAALAAHIAQIGGSQPDVTETLQIVTSASDSDDANVSPSGDAHDARRGGTGS